MLKKVMHLGISLGLGASVLLASSAQAQDSERLQAAINGEHRQAANVERDVYRNPYETLSFMRMEPHYTVVELYPGGGWYTEILAPYLRDSGQLIAAIYPRSEEDGASAFMVNMGDRYEAFLAEHPDVYDQVEMREIAPGQRASLAEPGSVDMLVDFRNAHNWIGWGAEEMLSSWHEALKVGGLVGIVDHRMDRDMEEGNGYIHESTLIDVMAANGFVLVDRSEVNANPADTKDHPGGVWNLPPNLRDVPEDQIQHYRDIGESDRLTMLFRKK